MKSPQQIPDNLSLPGRSIIEEGCLHFLIRGAPHDPHKGLAAGFPVLLFITLDAGLIHVQHPAGQQLFFAAAPVPSGTIPFPGGQEGYPLQISDT